MKRIYFILALLVLVGISFTLSEPRADEAGRTIVKKFKGAKAANTVIKGSGGVLFNVSGYASSANCTYSVHDASNVNGGSATTEGTANNVINEGGEATQYDSFPAVDFGEEGVPFVDGLIIMTTTCDIAVAYN